MTEAPLGCVAGWQAGHARQTRDPLVLLLTAQALADWVAASGPCPAVWPPSLDDVAPAGCQLGDLHRSCHEHLPRGASTAGAVIRW